jgi:iron-sulfur cluster assembly protein
MITISDKGAERVTHFLETRDSGIGIRLKVTTTGCSGFAYGIEFADEVNEDDNVFEDKGIKILVDAKSLLMVNGTELDYQTEGMNSGFTFKNPLEGETCGCGESFTMKKEEV